MNKTKYMTYITMFSSLAILLNIVESIYIPPIYYGIRFGLANIIALIVLEKLGIKSMIIVNINRVLISNILRGTIFNTIFWISFNGVLLSTIILIIVYYLKTSMIFKSIISAIAHTIGQVLVVSFIYSQVNYIIMIPILVIMSIISGVLTGSISILLLNRVSLKI